MTKEEIRHNNNIFLSQEETFDENNIYSAMDEYAKQECIEFLKWAVKEHSVSFEGFSLSGNRLLGGDTKFVNGEELTMSQFYELYLQSKSLVV
jgi:hypothetical protein